MVTFVHGGPSAPLTDMFAGYFAYWPYPFEVLAERGIAVFLPNYRGSHSYGRAFALPDGTEPEDDIITGVQSLVASGFADAGRLGITGHSHGAYLGPLVMAKARRFAVGSFAEAWANSILMYEVMSEDLNREVHDTVFGGSLYEAPENYLAASPGMRFGHLATAAMFEAGAYSAAVAMLGYPKAAHRAGMPTEFVVYPRGDHNLTLPRMQWESAKRNLDWLEFWLTGREDPDPAYAEQFSRWRESRRRRNEGH
jgi:dipeptidyl aminopeptidase/acylaminoacyl peptidase